MVELEFLDLESFTQRELSPLSTVKVMLPRCISKEYVGGWHPLGLRAARLESPKLIKRTLNVCWYHFAGRRVWRVQIDKYYAGVLCCLSKRSHQLSNNAPALGPLGFNRELLPSAGTRGAGTQD